MVIISRSEPRGMLVAPPGTRGAALLEVRHPAVADETITAFGRVVPGSRRRYDMRPDHHHHRKGLSRPRGAGPIIVSATCSPVRRAGAVLLHGQHVCGHP